MTEEAKIRNLSGMAEELSEWQQTHADPRRHSSEGWNPGDRRHGGEEMASFTECPQPVVTPVVIPATREWMV